MLRANRLLRGACIMGAIGAAAGCAPSAPAPRTPASIARDIAGRVLSSDEWAGFPEGGSEPSPAPSTTALACKESLAQGTPLAECQGKWITDLLHIGSEGGTIDGVVVSPSEIVVVVREHQSCGAYLPQANWRLLLPLPVRPIRLANVAASLVCDGQP